MIAIKNAAQQPALRSKAQLPFRLELKASPNPAQCRPRSTAEFPEVGSMLAVCTENVKSGNSGDEVHRGCRVNE
jgi:hypothetical protein